MSSAEELTEEDTIEYVDQLRDDINTFSLPNLLEQRLRDNLLHFSVPINDNGTLHFVAQPVEPEPPVYIEGMDDEEYARQLQEFYDHENDAPNPESFINSIIRRIRDNNYERLLNLGDELGNVSKGMSQKDINKLESYYITEKVNQTTCPICQEDFEINKTLVIQLVCNHIYCKDCIIPWLKDNKTCPICRTEQPCTEGTEVETEEVENDIIELDLPSVGTLE